MYDSAEDQFRRESLRLDECLILCGMKQHPDLAASKHTLLGCSQLNMYASKHCQAAVTMRPIMPGGLAYPGL